MAKENFDRSKPHLNIGTIGQTGQNTVGFVENDGAGGTRSELFIITDPDRRDTFDAAPVPIGPGDLLICGQDANHNEFCVETDGQATWQWTDFQMPIVQTPTGAPLLLRFDLNDVSGTPTAFKLGDSIAVTGGATPHYFSVDINNGDFESLVNPAGPSTTPYSGAATVVGFAQFNVPEPGTLLLAAAMGVAVLTGRAARNANRPRRND